MGKGREFQSGKGNASQSGTSIVPSERLLQIQVCESPLAPFVEVVILVLLVRQALTDIFDDFLVSLCKVNEYVVK